ncbi:MAG: cupin domain-containing protein [Pseudomonadota bacterium]
MTPENLFRCLPEHLEEEVFETLVERSGVTIERIVSRGQTSPSEGWYDQDRNEWVLVLQGDAELAFEDGTRLALGAGDHVDIPAHTRHRVVRTSVDPVTIWLAVHYGD